MKYTEKVHSTVMNAVKEMQKLDKLKADAQKNFAGDRLKTELETIFKQREQVRQDAQATVEACRAAYKAAVEKGTELDGSMLTDDAKILSSGIVLSAHQFSALVEKHRNNPLMTGLLKQYQNKHEGLYVDFVPSADAKITEFNSFCNTARSVLYNENGMQTAFFESGRCTPGICTENE